MDSDEELSEFEKIRNQNVELFNNYLKEQLSDDIEDSVNELNELVQTFQKPERPKLTAKRRINNAGRLHFRNLLPKRKSNRIATKEAISYIDMDADSDDGKENYEIPSDDLEEVIFKKKIYHRRSKFLAPQQIYNSINEDYISKVVYNVSLKIYCTKMGTSCHQCRQKTTDSKTICKSGRCVGVRGQFCGTCLHNRYGENAADALRNPKWVCPPCRGICNCSICRKRKGRPPTGILTPIAQAHGHRSVKDYLISLKAKGFDEEVAEKIDFQYLSGDLLGFSEERGAYIVPELDNDDVHGFYNNDMIKIYRETELLQIKFEKLNSFINEM